MSNFNKIFNIANSIRIGYIVVVVIVAIIAGLARGSILGENPKPIDTFSYVGTLATIVGLIVTICEIIYAVIENKKFNQEVKSKINSITDLSIQKEFSFLQNTLDIVISHVEDEKYSEALIHFRLFRRVYVLFEKCNDKIEKIEVLLSTASKAMSKLDKKQKLELKDLLIQHVKPSIDILSRKIHTNFVNRIEEISNDSITHS